MFSELPASAAADDPASLVLAAEAPRAAVLRDAAGIGVATGAYGLSFGALAVAAGLSVPQACALSALMFTGASQFAFVGLVGGGAAAAAATALLLGARNGLYGLRLSSLLGLRRVRRAVAAQFVIDESTAMALSRDGAASRLAFWATGGAVFVCWNLATLLGALAGAALSDPRTLGLDAAAPAAFAALLAPRLDGREARVTAAAAALAAVLAVPIAPAGVPVLVAAAVATAMGLRRRAGVNRARGERPDAPTDRQDALTDEPDAPAKRRDASTDGPDAPTGRPDARAERRRAA